MPVRLSHAAARARRIHPGAAAAGVIGAAALVLALLAGDGDTEFPGPSFEAGLLSQTPPSPAAEPSEAAMAPAARTPDALAERLVEDPVFDPQPRLDESTIARDAEPSLVPDPGAGGGEGGPAPDAIAVLAAASPQPADPALRVLESLRNRPPPGFGDDEPASPAAADDGDAAAGEGNVATGPGFTVQLVAMARREQALTAWDRLHRDNANLLGRLQPIIVEPERRVSTLYRLRAGPLASAREAMTLCASLARRGVDCIVVEPGG
ncbi:MAG: SPOR domain-containing protein [Rhodospirillales bacterium]